MSDSDQETRINDVDELKRVLANEYGVEVVKVDFVDGGFDTDAIRWKVTDTAGTRYFAKVSPLRFGAYRSLRHVVSQVGQGIVMPVLEKLGLLPWAGEELFWVHLFPFIEGTNGLEKPLVPEQIREVGGLLRGVHDSQLTTDESSGFPKFDFESPAMFSETDTVFAKLDDFPTRTASQQRLWELLNDFESDMINLQMRASELGETYRKFVPPFVPCHTDIHVGNILTDPEGAIHILDWDTARLAPREIDFIFFVDGGLFGHEPGFEAAFWEGYGRVNYDRKLLTFFQYARAIEDIEAFTVDAFNAKSEEEAKFHADYLEKQFAPGSILSLAKSNDVV